MSRHPKVRFPGGHYQIEQELAGPSGGGQVHRGIATLGVDDTETLQFFRVDASGHQQVSFGEVVNTLEQMLVELKKINIHLELLSDGHVANSDVEE